MKLKWDLESRTEDATVFRIS